MELRASLIIKNSVNLKECIDSINSEYKNINTYIEELKSGWMGEKATKFYNAVENIYLPELKTAVDSMSNYYDYISKVPKAYETLDNSYSSKNIEV